MIDINKTVVSNKFPFDKQNLKYFIGYKDSEKTKPLCIFGPQIIIYERNIDENRHIYFLIKEEKVFIKYMDILEKVSNVIKSKYNSELICSKKYLKAKKRQHTHKSSLLMYICANNIDWFNLSKRWKLLSQFFLRKTLFYWRHRNFV